MKKHAIIPIFISHMGCPHNCVFCDQKKITSRKGDVSVLDARKTIDEWLTTLENSETEVEIAFYGGSFTGIPIDRQNEFLSLAKEYKDKGKVSKIHLSTRPDYISKEILDNLKKYTVDTIELGVQSFSDDVLNKSERGHSSAIVYESAKLIKEYNFTLGIQLMIGLPGDTFETSIYSANETVKIKPDIARIYPTVTIKGTKLYDMYLNQEFKPLDLDEAVLRAKEIYKILTSNGINVIRIGLKSSEIMDNELGFHPAFRQLVESSLARELIEEKLNGLKNVIIYSNSRSFSNIYGHKGINKEYFLDKYPGLTICGKIDNSLKDNEYIVVENKEV